jgi:hypothetical protein
MSSKFFREDNFSLTMSRISAMINFKHTKIIIFKKG